MSNKSYENHNKQYSSHVYRDDSNNTSGCFVFFIGAFILFIIISSIIYMFPKNEEDLKKLKDGDFSVFFNKEKKDNKKQDPQKTSEVDKNVQVKKYVAPEPQKLIVQETRKEIIQEPKNDVVSESKKDVGLDNKKTTTSFFNSSQENRKWEMAYRYIKNGELVNLFNFASKTKDFSEMYYNDKPAICIASEYGQYEIMKYLLHEFDCKNLTDRKTGRTPLHYAVKNGDTKIAELLIENGIDVNACDSEKNTALHYSINNPFQECMELLLKGGANPNAENIYKQTPLHKAAMKSNLIAIRLLLEYGGEINKQDQFGNTLLHYINLYAQQKEILDVLYGKYEKKMDLTIKNNDGKTPRNIRYWDYFEYYEEHYR